MSGGRSSGWKHRASRILAVPLILAGALALVPALPAPCAHAQEAPMTPGPPTPVAADPELKKVLTGVICRCGCNLSVYDCEGTMTCDVAAQMRADAEAKLATGMTADAALMAFAAEYGEQVLAAPTKQGFNLTAWVLPFAALGAGGLGLAFALRSWRSGRSEGPEAVLPEVDPRYAAAVEAAVEEEE